MYIKIKVSILLVAVFLSTLGVNSVFSQTNGNTAEIRERVIKYGVGKKVSVSLKDGTKYKGKIKTIDRDNFSIQDRKNKLQTFSFTEVRKVKKSSYTKWIVIAVVAGVATAIMIPLSMRCRNEGANALCL